MLGTHTYTFNLKDARMDAYECYLAGLIDIGNGNYRLSTASESRFIATGGWTHIDSGYPDLFIDVNKYNNANPWHAMKERCAE